MSRFALVRKTVLTLRKKHSLRSYSAGQSRLESVFEIPEVIAALRRRGYCTGLNLPAKALAELQRFAASEICYGDADPGCGFSYSDKRDAQAVSGRIFSQATYLFADRMRSVIDGIARDPLLLDIAARYMNASPVITGTRLWWVFATPEDQFNSSVTTNFFHYDKDDYSALRMFFYVTPVPGNDHGPHVVVSGSHMRKKFSQYFSLGERGDRDITDSYSKDDITTIYGPAGSGFAEDPFCFHKATRPVAADRLMFEIKYATRDYKIFPGPDPSTARNVLAEPLLSDRRRNVA